MRRSFSEALAHAPLLLEPTPPSARASAHRAAEHLEQVAALVRRLPRIDLIDVPELVDENHEGRPYYRSGDPRSFAQRLGAATDCPVAVNKVVAHLDSAPAVEAWARETVGLGLRQAILVGGSSRYIPYPGPPVVEANRVARPVFAAAGGGIGNIAIPQRTGEAHRLLAKTRAGATFFTTQILFDSRAALEMIEEYDALCRTEGIAPAAVILSFAPIIDEGDVEFIRWLGAEIAEEAEREILGGGEGDASPQRSVRHSLKIWEEVHRGIVSRKLAVPVGVNVEEIMPRHFGAAAALAEAFSENLRA